MRMQELSVPLIGAALPVHPQFVDAARLMSALDV